MISVIIPIYEHDQYLDSCLGSIAAQSEKDLDILGILDGPSKRIVGVFDRWKEKDARIRYEVTEHAGLGHARATGIELARGEYLTFCDSDDTLPASAYRLLLQAIIKEKADVVTGGFTRVYDDGKHSLYTVPQLKNEKFAVFFDYPMVWNRLFRTDFLRNNRLSFPQVSQGDDLLFMADLYLCQPHCAVVPENVYFWHMHELGEKERLSDSHDAGEFLELLKSLALFKEKLMPFEPELVMENLQESCDFLLQRFRILDTGSIDMAEERLGKFIRSLEWGKAPELFFKTFQSKLDELGEMTDGDLRHFLTRTSKRARYEDGIEGK
jgi:glycosyltransferase involved in cell wall biosynthesis